MAIVDAALMLATTFAFIANPASVRWQLSPTTAKSVLRLRRQLRSQHRTVPCLNHGNTLPCRAVSAASAAWLTSTQRVRNMHSREPCTWWANSAAVLAFDRKSASGIWHLGGKHKVETTCCAAEARSARPRLPLWRPWPGAGHRSRPAEGKNIKNRTPRFPASSLEPLPTLLPQLALRRLLFSPVRLSDGLPFHTRAARRGSWFASQQHETQLPSDQDSPNYRHFQCR